MSVQLICLVLLVAIADNTVFSAPIENDLQTNCDRSNQTVIKKYPLTDPITEFKYRIAMISDLDEKSKIPQINFTWFSYLKEGYLTYNPQEKNVLIEWEPENMTRKFTSNLASEGRGLELSELVTYNGQLITLDDKTGLVYEIKGDGLIPWVILAEGDGHQTKGMKNEWATVKDSKLYVGSHGNERKVKDGVPLTEKNLRLMWVKVVDKNGGVEHLNWTENYIKLRAAFNIHFPGYMVHEACVWSDVHNRWFFLPRKASVDKFNPETDPRKATNVLLSASPDFENITVQRIGEVVPDHGYSSFKFVPGTNHTVITAIKTMEEDDQTATYITVFNIDGTIIYPETKVADVKYEGFEFI